MIVDELQLDPPQHGSPASGRSQNSEQEGMGYKPQQCPRSLFPRGDRDGRAQYVNQEMMSLASCPFGTLNGAVISRTNRVARTCSNQVVARAGC
jgi:hypothetical protein